MITSNSTGITVHAISNPVWWLVLLGIGFAFALNRTITITSSAATKMVVNVMIQSTRSCRSLIFCLIRLAAGCMPTSHGFGACAKAPWPPGIASGIRTVIISAA